MDLINWLKKKKKKRFWLNKVKADQRMQRKQNVHEQNKIKESINWRSAKRRTNVLYFVFVDLFIALHFIVHWFKSIPEAEAY